MKDEHRPTVNVATHNGEYEVSGFENEDEAREFIHTLDSLSAERIEVTGPF